MVKGRKIKWQILIVTHPKVAESLGKMGKFIIWLIYFKAWEVVLAWSFCSAQQRQEIQRVNQEMYT